MDLNNLKPAKGSVKSNTRLGRGEGSKKGGTAGRGTKGQQSRNGYTRKFGFEGGQMPLHRRAPKFGFKNIFKEIYQPINLDTIQYIVDKLNLNAINPDILYENGFISKNAKVKILARGELKKAVEVSAHAFSKKAIEEIEKIGGNVKIID
ncbi:MAG TPA: 50S ribosomal protein L15 [Bacteroidales bacterium]|jgi:large subunit ribosomal protein L15|nr:50S ribosomal protein L15 [Bacteroidales bacterium]HCM29817.1 50S ribosomal protein L15 [Bacteroidales bacterium]HNY75141.1 50S ribosomal protein L15 [Bacteroidales bacterium]HOF06538.1 50S ribosomal protein L15 [Bacteroidales bacterium]HOH93094.1 50S ribosomal protein L15 [Bacteroidales bacterium]